MTVLPGLWDLHVHLIIEAAMPDIFAFFKAHARRPR
jgi:hypothetical protein